jgi:D-threonate/D-erythronate kinase
VITILADDLTGAAEVAGVCLRYGLKVAFGVNALPGEDAEAWVIATDSRSMSLTEACETHHRLALALKAAGREVVFKKTDSVLRGYIVAELAELMQVYGLDKALLQPSNPAVGRCIRDAVYTIAGEPIHQTAFAADPDFPARSSSVEVLLASRSEWVGTVRPTLYTKSVPAENPGIYVPDCLTETAMRNGVEMPLEEGIFAGSAAFLAIFLEEKFGLNWQKRTETTDPMSGAFLMVCGSAHAQSRTFIKQSGRQGIPVAEFPASLLKEKENVPALLHWADSQVALWQESGCRMILTLGSEPVTFTNSSEVLKERLATVVQQFLDQCPVHELMIEGGATAFAILRRQGWETLLPEQELAPGVVRMKVLQRLDLHLTMKPGSYQWS